MATTFNPSDLFSVTLSNGNLTATSNNNAGDNTVRSTKAHSAPAKVHVEFVINTGVSGGGVVGVGLANAVYDITTGFLGNDNNSLVCFNNSPAQWFYNSANNLHMTGVSFGAGDTVALEFDFGAKISRFQNFTQAPGVWNQGLGDFSFSTLNPGPYFICVNFDTNPAAALTANFGATAFVVTPTAGFTSWAFFGTSGFTSGFVTVPYN